MAAKVNPFLDYGDRKSFFASREKWWFQNRNGNASPWISSSSHGTTPCPFQHRQSATGRESQGSIHLALALSGVMPWFSNKVTIRIHFWHILSMSAELCSDPKVCPWGWPDENTFNMYMEEGIVVGRSPLHRREGAPCEFLPQLWVEPFLAFAKTFGKFTFKIHSFFIKQSYTRVTS